MNTKHTPGPWDWFSGRSPYLATPDRGRLYIMDFVRSGMHAATARFSRWTDIESGTERERMGGIMHEGVTLEDGSLHPDARLIAAAPELLEACRKALSCASIDTSVRELIRSAISKATA